MHSNINILSFSISHQQPRTELTDAKIHINIANLQEEYIILRSDSYRYMALRFTLASAGEHFIDHTSKTLQDREA